MNSVREGEWLRETGPNTLFESSPAIRGFIDGIGLGDVRLTASVAARRRYVVRAGKPVALPDSPRTFATTPLLSLGAKFNLLGEPFRARAPAESEESVAEFVNRRLGPEFLDYIVNPFVAGVYAGDPAELSVRHAFPKLHALEQEFGSLTRGSLARRNGSGGPRGSMVSFPDGLAEIPRALARALGSNLRLKHRVTRLVRTAGGWRVVFFRGGTQVEEDFTAVICALPPEILAELRFEGVPDPTGLALLRGIPQPPVASVFLGFRREDVSHPLDGFGLLTPAVEKRRILGTLFSSTLFPRRAPAGHVALTTFVGGTRQPELARADEGELVDSVREELASLLGVGGRPVVAHVQRWNRSIPQYTVGFQRFQEACACFEGSAPGLFIGGTCRDGVSLANCIAAGERLAGAAALHLTPR